MGYNCDITAILRIATLLDVDRGKTRAGITLVLSSLALNPLGTSSGRVIIPIELPDNLILESVVKH
jgi:hypothetical protein